VLIHTAFPQQQWLHEHACYTYIGYLVVGAAAPHFSLHFQMMRSYFQVSPTLKSQRGRQGTVLLVGFQVSFEFPD
jgi:hypothetical protein